MNGQANVEFRHWREKAPAGSTTRIGDKSIGSTAGYDDGSEGLLLRLLINLKKWPIQSNHVHLPALVGPVHPTKQPFQILTAPDRSLA